MTMIAPSKPAFGAAVVPYSAPGGSVAVAPISVLMSSYAGERAEYLAAALRSCVDQTVVPAEIVLVLDGPVGVDQHAAIGAFAADAARAGARLVTVPLAHNVGLGAAMNAGLAYCTEPYVARMDSDDVCDRERFAEQWRVLRERPGVDLLASWQADFESDPARTFRVKTVPETHDEIVRVLRWRNAVPHPSIVVKRDALVRVGGYHPVLYLEDYDLFMRLAAAGARFHAIQRPLVHVRVTEHQRRRRGGWGYVVRDVKFRWSLYRRGDISLMNYCASTAMYAGFRLAPPGIKKVLYSTVRRSRAEATGRS